MYEPLTKATQKEELNTVRRLKKELKPSQTVFQQMKFMPGAELNYREKQNVPYRQQSLGDFRKDSSKGKEGTGGSLLPGVNFLLSTAYPVQRSSAPAGGASGSVPIVFAHTFESEVKYKDHFNKHVIIQKEFGNITIFQYLEQANALIANTKALTKIRGNNDNIYYLESTNEFCVTNSDGVIKTYFKPRDGIAYFNRQS